MSQAPRNTAGRKLDAPAPLQGRWYEPGLDGEEHETERAQRLMTAAEHIWQRMAPYRTMWATCARNYGDAVGISLGVRGYRDAAPKPSGSGSKLSLNLTKSVCDSYVALVTEDRPKVTFLTNDGDAELQERAKDTEVFVDGIAYDQDLALKDELLEGDVAKFGTAVEWYERCDADPDGPRILIQRGRCWEVLVDDTEYQTGCLRNLGRIRLMDRGDLLEEFADDEEKCLAIKQASGTAFDMGANQSSSFELTMMDPVAVVTMYHLPRTTKSGDGRWCRVLGSVVLDQGEWTRLDFPCEMLYRLPPGEGIWGSAIADEVRGLQTAVNTLTRMIDRSHHLLGAGHWLIPNGGHINTNKMDNQIGSMIGYDIGFKPELAVPGQSIGGDVYQERDRLFQYAYQLFGMTPMTAQGELPPGIKSGRAMRDFAGIQQKRFKPAYAQYQSFYLRRAKQILALAREIGEDVKDYQVKAAGEDVMQAVKASNLLREEEYTLKMYPTNALSNDPVERIEQVQEIQGLPPEMKRLLDFPDLKAAASYEDASYNMTMKCITRILKGGEYIGPEVYMNLKDDIKTMQLARVKARYDNVPDAKLRLMQNWIDQAVEMRDSPQYAQMNPGAGPSVPGPTGPGGPPPLRAPGASPLPPMPPGMAAQPMPQAA